MRFATCPELWGFTGALQRDIFNESAGVADLAQSILDVDWLRLRIERQLSLQEGRIEDLESVDRVAKQVLVKPILPIKDPRRPACAFISAMNRTFPFSLARTPVGLTDHGRRVASARTASSFMMDDG